MGGAVTAITGMLAVLVALSGKVVGRGTTFGVAIVVIGAILVGWGSYRFIKFGHTF